MENLQYTVSENERWDTVSFKAYGNPGFSESLIRANPEVGITAIIPVGTILNIPVQEENQVLNISELLPPWKRP